MDVKDFWYDLPEELIAQDPLEDRASSRLLVLDKDTGEITHKHFYDIIDYLDEGDCLVLNETKVIPARLMGVKKDTGAAIEILLLKRKSKTAWECLVKPGKKCKVGAVIEFGDGLLIGTISDIVEEGNRIIEFEFDGIFEEILDKLGTMPLPPYITHALKDKNRYQTVYAKTKEAADIINSTKANGKRVICVGTTSTRTVESAADENGHLEEKSGWTEIFIYPGYKFKVLDALITNFHLPESTLVMLVSALAGRENILNAYEEAVKEKYRFFSFGDAMFIK